jgi:hypothetical protein
MNTIGLNAFLFRCWVPDVASPLYGCGVAPETPAHLALDCLATPKTLIQHLDLRTYGDYCRALDQPGAAKALAKWMLRLGRLRQFDLAQALCAEEAANEARGIAGRGDGRGAGGPRGR